MKRFTLSILFIVFMTTLMFAQWDIDEGFEGGAIPGDWTIHNNGWDAWAISSYSTYVHDGTYSAAVQLTFPPTDDWLVTPQVSIESGDRLQFWGRQATTYSRRIRIMLSTSGTAIADFTTTICDDYPTPQTWVYYDLDLSAHAGDVYLAFYHDSGGSPSGGFAVDEVLVGQEPSAEPPAIPGNVVVTINGDDVDISWDASADATDYRVEYSADPYTGYVELTASTGGALTWPHTDGALLTKYFYKVIALN